MRHLAQLLSALMLCCLAGQAHADRIEVLIPVHFEHLHPNVVEINTECTFTKMPGYPDLTSTSGSNGGGDGSSTFGKIINGAYDGVLMAWMESDKAILAGITGYSCKIVLRYDDPKGASSYSYINGTWWSKFGNGSASGVVTGKF